MEACAFPLSVHWRDRMETTPLPGPGSTRPSTSSRSTPTHDDTDLHSLFYSMKAKGEASDGDSVAHRVTVWLAVCPGVSNTWLRHKSLVSLAPIMCYCSANNRGGKKKSFGPRYTQYMASCSHLKWKIWARMFRYTLLEQLLACCSLSQEPFVI